MNHGSHWKKWLIEKAEFRAEELKERKDINA